MAFKKSFKEIIGTVLVLSTLLSTASAVDCQGKSFHCVNTTHFMICVDLGGGVSQTIDDFIIPCPAPTVCLGTNHFECEFPAVTTPVASLNVISETTQPWEDVVVTTNSPQRKTTKEYSEKYLNTESLSLVDSFTTDTTVDYNTEAPLSSAPIDLNNINIAESVSIVREGNVYETTTTVDTITEPVLIIDTTTNLDQVVNAENFTAEFITEIPKTIPENIATGAIEVTTEIPLLDITTTEAFISNASDVPQIIPENITTGAGEAITETPLVDITTVEAFVSNASDVPQITPQNITTGAGEAITEIPLVEISTTEAFISNASDVPQIIPENITTGAGEAITEIPLVDISTVEASVDNASDVPQLIPENITTGAGEAITEISLADIATTEAFISNSSDVLQLIPENITTGAGEAITEIPLVDVSTVEAFVSNASDVPQIIPQNIMTGAGESITEIHLADISTTEVYISNTSDVPQIIPENITTGAGEAITEITLADISTTEAFISNSSDLPQLIPENITTGAGEAITEIPLVDVSTVEAFVSNASDVPQIIPENITTGAGEAITEIPLVDIITIEAFVSNASDVPQITSENITIGAGEAITEIPLVDVSTVEEFVSNASDVRQLIPENITKGAGEAITEISLVDITTIEAFVSNASDVPQVTSENITTGAGEAITEIPLADIVTTEAFISNSSDVPQLIPENITTGAGEAITEIPLADIATTEAFVSNASDVPQIIPENITTGAGESITEIHLADVSTTEAFISNASDVPQIIPQNITTGAGEAITEIPLVDITTIEAFVSNASDVPQIISENITTGSGEAITEIPLVDVSTVEAFVSNASDVPQIIPDNITKGAGEAITEIPLVDITATEAFISNSSDVPQIIPENITTGAGEGITEIPLADISTMEAFIRNASDVPQIIPENIMTGAGESITEIHLADISTTEVYISNASDVPQIIPENITTGAGEAITELTLADISTTEAFISNASDVPQIIPENITIGAGEAITEIPLVDVSTVEDFVSNASDVPQLIPENITTGAGEAITEIPLVDVSTVEAFISNASDVPQIIPENITTGAGEAITEIPLVDITTVEAFVSNASDVPQVIPENITTGAGEAITEIPLVDISTVEAFISNASDLLQIITEDITTAAGEVITEIPLVDIPTTEAFISNASDVLQIIPEDITTAAGEAITEIPLVDITQIEAFISNASDVIILENITTGAGEAVTEIPLVDITTTEAFISNAPDVPQITPENITTGAGEAITEIPLVDITKIGVFISNASDIPQIIPENITTGPGEEITEIPNVTANTNNIVPETTPSTISANESSSNINVSLKPVPESTPNINITSNATVNVKDYPETTLNTDKTIGTEQVVTTTTEESYTTGDNSLTNNQLGSTGDLVRNSDTLEQTTSDYLSFDMESLNTNQPSTIDPEEILTTDTTVNRNTELPALNEHNSLNQLPTTIKTAVNQDGVIIDSVATENPTLLINQKEQTHTDDIYTTERSLIVTKNDQVQTISTDDKLRFTTESNLSMNKTDIVSDANTNNLTAENIISFLQNKTQIETNDTITQEATIFTTENGLFKDNAETKSTVADLPIRENKIDSNILANTIFDTVISKAELSTEKLTPAISDKKLQTVAKDISTTETSLSTSNDQIQQVTGDVALGKENATLIPENNVIMDNANLINEKIIQNVSTQFPQDQVASAIESGHVATEQSNINTSDNAATTENSVYLPTDNSILTTIKGFDEKLQSPNSTEQPITVTFDEKLQTLDNENVKTERPIFSTTNEQSPLKVKDEKYLGKEKPIFINSDNLKKDVNNFTIENSKVNIINDTEETITINPQDGAWSTKENKYIKDEIIKVQPEIPVITTHSTTNTDILESNSLTTITNNLDLKKSIISDLQANTIINKSNEDAEQANVAGTLVTVASNDNKTMTESSNGPTTKGNPQSINNKTSKDITAASVNDVHTIATTTKIVNNSIDNYDVSSSSVPVRNNETKNTVLENIQNALQAIGNFFNTASNNLTRVISNINNVQVQTENNIHVSEVMTEANTATESETVLDSTVLNNLQVSKASEMVQKPDANIKLGSTQSALVNKGQNIENKNINKPVAHIVPFDEPSGLTNKAQDQVTTNVEVSKNRKITSGISPEIVMKPATLTTKTNEIGSDGTANDNEGDLISAYDSKVFKIEITTESYKPVISNSTAIIPRTTAMPNNLLQNLPLPRVVPVAENIPIFNTKELGISSTSEKTITNGVRPDIGPVFVNINTNLNEKSNVENAIARENVAQNIRPIATLIPGNTQEDPSITNIKLEQTGLAQNAKPPTYETNSSTRNPANVVPENFNQIIVPSNQQSDLTGKQNAPVSTVGKEIKPHVITTTAKISTGINAVKTPIPQNNTQKITSTRTVFPGNNTSAVPKNRYQTETNNKVPVISRNNTIGGNEQKTINVQQNSSVDTTGQFKQQVTSTKKPVQKPNSSLTSTTQASTTKPASKSVLSTVSENPKKQVVNNNTLNYSCINGVRGRYSDKNDCRKFYICIGYTQPIIGHCPVNTVFSDIKKLCTKNMSHCIRGNEFKCPSDGRFSDVIQDAVYYICVNHSNHLYRFKFQCQKGFTLNKTTVRCVENKEIESNESVSISSDNVSESSDSTSSTSTSSISTSSTSSSSRSSSSKSSSSSSSGDRERKSSKSKQKKEKSEEKDDDDDEVFECEKQGKFPVRNECRRYYLCKKNRRGQYRRKLKKCDSGDVFHKSKKKCVDADDYEC